MVKLDSTSFGTIASLLLLGCSVIQLPQKGAESQNAEPQSQSAPSPSPKGPHQECTAGKPLDPNTLNTNRLQWERFSPVAASGERTRTENMTLTCTMMRSFAHDCPAWDAEAPGLAVRACLRDLELQHEAVEQKLGRLVSSGASDGKGIELRDATAADLWPDSGTQPGFLVAVARLRDLAPNDDKSRAALGRAEQLREEVKDVNAAASQVSTLSDSCADLTSLAKLAKESKGKTHEYYEQAHAKKRTAQIAFLEERLRALLGAKVETTTANLADLRAQIAEARKTSTELQCVAADESPAVLSKVDSWAAQREKAITEEEACRASDACLGERLVPALCSILEDKKAAEARLRQIKQDGARFGVVDLRELKEAGEDVRSHEERYKETAKEYSTLTKRAFSAAKCKDLL